MSSPLAWFAVTLTLVFLVALGIAHFVRWHRRRGGIQPARGKHLDRLVSLYGVERERGESDKKLRARVKDIHDSISRNRMHGPPPWARP